MINDNLLGTSAAITGQQTAMDILQARLEAAQQQNAAVGEAAASGSGFYSPPFPSSRLLTDGSESSRYASAGGGNDGYFGGGSGGNGGGGWGGGGNNGGGPYDDGLGGGPEDPFYGNEYFRQRTQNRQYWNNHRSRMADDSSNEEPFSATFASTIDAPNRLYDDNLRGRIKQNIDSLKDRFGETFTSVDMQFALGFGAMSSVMGLERATSPMLSGESYLPDQVAQQSGTSLLPLGGAVLGTVIGGRFGMGLAGQFVGQSVGQGAEEALDTYATGHTFAQETAGQSLGAGRGGAAAVNEFVQALQSATGATKDVAEVFQKMGQSGPVSAAGVAGIAGLQSTLGTAFVQTAGDVDTYLKSSPFTAGLSQGFGTNNFNSDQLFGQSLFAYAHGDFEAGLSLNAAGNARNVRATETSAYRRDSDTVAAYDNAPFWMQILSPRAAWEADNAENRMRTEPRYQSGVTPAQQASAAALATQGQQMFEQFQVNSANTISGQAGAAQNIGVIQTAQLRGAGAAELRGMMPALEANLGTERTALESQAGLDRRIMAQYPNDPILRAQSAADIAQQHAAEERLSVQEAGLTRGIFETGMQEEQGRYSLTTLRATLEGRAPSVIAAEERRQARFLEDVQGPISPAERYQLQGEAAQLRYTAAQQQYGQEEGAVNLGVSRASAGVQIAAGGGTPQEVYQAQTALARELTELQRQYNSEVERGNLTWEQANEKRREAVALSGQINNIQDTARQQYFGGVEAIDDANTGSVQAGLSRSVAISGNIAYAALTGPNAAAVADAQRAVSTAPAGSVEQARARERLASLQAAGADNATNIQTFSTTSAERTRLSRDESAFRVSMDAPFLDGPDSNPLTRGNALLSDLTGLRSEAQRALDASRDPLSIERNTAIVGGYNEQIASLQRERMTGLFRALPEGIDGGTNDGYGVYATPSYALSAAMGGPNPMIGSIGRPHFGPTPQGNVSAAGAFLDASGGGESRAVSLLERIAQALERGGSVSGPQNAPHGDSFGVLRHDMGRTFDTSRPLDHLTR